MSRWRRQAADISGTRGEADVLRDTMVDQIVAATARWRPLQLAGELQGPVEAALRTVPRHLFTPGVPLATAYENTPVVIKTNERSASLSPVSAPGAIALMLTQLDVRPCESVLEIGSGGYQAALLRELVGPHGLVTTLDIDPDVTGRARACLDRAGYGDVRTVCGDGEDGAPGYGPFDKIIVAVQAWDIPPAWTAQLAPHGRLVLPLLTRWLTRSWALDRQDGHLVSRSRYPCAFVPMQGAGKHRTGRSRWTRPARACQATSLSTWTVRRWPGCWRPNAQKPGPASPAEWVSPWPAWTSG